MGNEITAVGTVHAPFIVGRPDLAPPERKQRVYEGFEELRSYVDRVSPDVIVTFSNEHITNFVPSNVPSYCVSVGSTNPTVGEFRLPERDVPGDSDFAKNLVIFAYDNGFDVGHSKELALDHGTGLPLHFLTPKYDIPVVVILQNVIFSPFPTVERSFQLGKLVGRFVREEKGGMKVMFLATGGISHWVGNSRHGEVNQEFDEWFLEKIRSGDLESLCHLSQDQIDLAGDGANEIRNWIAAAGAAAPLSSRVVLDETFIPGWNTSAYQVIWE